MNLLRSGVMTGHHSVSLVVVLLGVVGPTR